MLKECNKGVHIKKDEPVPAEVVASFIKALLSKEFQLPAMKKQLEDYHNYQVISSIEEYEQHKKQRRTPQQVDQLNQPTQTIEEDESESVSHAQAAGAREEIPDDIPF